MAATGDPSPGQMALPTAYQPPSADTDEEENNPQDQKHLTETHASLLCNVESPKLREAIVQSRKEIVDSWLKYELREATPKTIETYEDQLKTPRQINHISTFIRQNLYRPGEKRTTNVNVEDQLERHPQILEFYIQSAFDEFIFRSEFSQRDRRDAINRILKIKQQNGTYYDVLGVPKSATRQDILQARRRVSRKVHPDKSDDTEANNCATLVNTASEVLLDPVKKKEYDRSVARIPKPAGSVETFGEDFAAGAFNKRSDSDSDSDSDVEGNGSKFEPPPIPDDVEYIHSRLAKYVEAFFSNLDSENGQALRKIRKKNESIQKLNDQAGRKTSAYTVDPEVLQAMRGQQLNAVEKQLTPPQARKALRMAAHGYRKSATLHQWPAEWVTFIERPVRERLFGADKHTDEWGDMDVDENASVYSSADVDPMSVTKAHQSPTHSQSLARPLQPLRAGYTLLGDKILGYRVLRRWNKIMGQYIISGFKFLVATQDSSLLTVVSGAEITEQAAHAYHNLPEDEKNDVGESLEVIAKMRPEDYRKITMLGWVKSQGDSEGRFPETWIAVEMQRDSNVTQYFVHRTAFRKLIRHADKLIDGFCVENDIEPPWDKTPFPDPSNAVRYMSLHYPAPRRRAWEGRDSYSRLAITRQPERTDIATTGETDEMKMLVKQMMTMMAKESEEREKDRQELREQRNLVNQLLRLQIGNGE